MRESLLEVLRAPQSGERLQLHAFEWLQKAPRGTEEVVDGLLISETTNRPFPIIGGVPVMLPAAFPPSFLTRHSERIKAISKFLGPMAQIDREGDWSFSAEWEHHFEKNLMTTWGWTVEERVRQFLMETNTTVDECHNKWILDAGSGNGQLSEGLATELGAFVVGLDYSTSVIRAEQARVSPHVHFIRGDLRWPPFDQATFDIVISNGVLHHTPDTHAAFRAVARVVKPGGHFYVWLYRRPEGFRSVLKLLASDAPRQVVSRLPASLQKWFVNARTAALWMRDKMRGERSYLSWAERTTGSFDALTPRWRHYHTPIEVSGWFYESGYSPATLTHWNNQNGFGMVATRSPSDETPGRRSRQ